MIRVEMLKTQYFKQTRLLVPFLFIFGSSLSHAADTNKGSEIYATHCSACHGVSGVSVMPNAPNFSQNEGLMSSDRALLISILAGKAAMPSYRGVLSEQDILDVIAYLRTLN
jgi:cytochrome c6